MYFKAFFCTENFQIPKITFLKHSNLSSSTGTNEVHDLSVYELYIQKSKRFFNLLLNNGIADDYDAVYEKAL